jgi:nitroimidazol reductase NimA-like FMN-containing flavoprotein (pyridoxamine 5'-phosphate oxidase superfamily)
MGESYTDQLKKVRKLLQTAQFAAMATVNEDGTPHNTPLFFMYDDNFSHIYWGSNQHARHSHNVERTGQAYFVLYDSSIYGNGGLYVATGEAHRLEGAELDEGLAVHNAMRAKHDHKPLQREYYECGEQAMYRATVLSLEIYTVEKYAGSNLIKGEPRHPVSAIELIGQEV